MALVGPGAAAFAATSTCSILAPLAACTVSIVCQPAAGSVGTGTATLILTDTRGAAAPVGVDLSCGVVPPLP